MELQLCHFWWLASLWFLELNDATAQKIAARSQSGTLCPQAGTTQREAKTQRDTAQKKGISQRRGKFLHKAEGCCETFCFFGWAEICYETFFFFFFCWAAACGETFVFSCWAAA